MPIRYESVETNIQALGQPLKFAFSGRVAKNRFLKTAMAETLASWDPADPETQGAPNEQHINLYRR
ncbi:FMN-linked oxidoreductase [Ilyonectria robusta]